MSDPSVSERRIRPIQDAIATTNWKQALQLCDKWAKKGENSDRFLALKAFVLVNQPDATQQQRGLSETKSLSVRKPAVTDIAALHQIQDTFKQLSLHTDEESKIWDRAVAANPTDKKLLMTWMGRSVSESDWLSAGKATTALRKAFPQERKYDFWNILMCHLINQDASLQEKDRTLFGTLAYRLISKASEAVPKDKNQLLSSGKAVQTPEELFLLTTIYNASGHAPEAAKLLDTESFGLESRFAEQDSQLIMSVLLETLEISQQWEKALDVCTQLLSNEKYHAYNSVNDERVWKLLFISAKAFDPNTYQDRLRSVIAERLKVTPNLRSTHLARLSLAQEDHTSPSSQETLLAMCKDYYHDFASKGYCFEDLKKPLSHLDSASLSAFLASLDAEPQDVDSSAEVDLDRRLLNLKLRYCFLVPTSTDTAVIRDFSSRALQLYGRSKEQSSPLTEACLLAALALVEIGLQDAKGEQDRSECLVQAAVILGGCCEQFEECYPALVLLIRLQLLLGLVSSAMMNFKKLSVKNVQWETMGHLILTRISTMHPLQYGKITPSDDAGFNPLEALDLTLEVAENAGKSLSRMIMEGLNCGSYVNVAGSVQMKLNMERSLNRQIAALEERRVQQIGGLLDDSELLHQPSQLVDQRDLSSFCDFTVSGSAASCHTFCGPLPQKLWLLAMNLPVQATILLANAQQSQSGTISLPLLDLRKIMSQIKELDVFESKELTSAEIHSLECHQLVAEAILHIYEPSAANQERLNEIMSKIEDWLEGKSSPERPCADGSLRIGDVPTPTWEYLHISFSRLETLQLLALFAAVTSKRSKGANSKGPTFSKEQITSLQKLIVTSQRELQDKTKKLRAELNASGVLGRLVDVAAGRSGDGESNSVGVEIEKLCDAATLETLCGDMKNSWEDALDGILAVKIKQFK